MLKIKSLYLEDFRGYPKTEFKFGDFNCFIGPNGIGKTTALEAVNLLCSSLVFGSQERIEAYLRKNIRNVEEKDSARGFKIVGTFDNDGRDLVVEMTEKGFSDGKGMTQQPWWWMGICFFARFDQDMTNFVLPLELWPTFSKYYEMITGIPIEPEFYEVSFDKRYESELARAAGEEVGKQYVVGFWMNKRGSRVHSKKCSAGEKKISRALSQIVTLPPERQPHIVLVDNLEMHVHYKRHLMMVEALKEMFQGKQLLTTTHSLVLIDQCKDGLIDVEESIYGKPESQASNDPQGASRT